MALMERKLWKAASFEEINNFITEEYKKEIENLCPVDKLKEFADRVRRGSCGECVICREGILQLYVIAEGISKGIGRERDIEVLKEISQDMIIGSSCDYGRKVGKIAASIIEDGQEQFEKHIKRKRCDALMCKKFFSYFIAPEKCTGCNKCTAQCDEKAIAGSVGLIHVINSAVCSRCGKCVIVCDAIAIEKVGAVLPKLPEAPIPVGNF